MSSAARPPAACMVVRGSRGLCLQQPPDYTIHQAAGPYFEAIHTQIFTFIFFFGQKVLNSFFLDHEVTQYR